MTFRPKTCVMLNLQIARLPTPELEFCGPGPYADPRRGLLEAGPFDMRFGAAHRTQVRLALVGTPEIVDQAQSWFKRCQRSIRAETAGGSVLDYPGFAAVFRSELVVDDTWQVLLDQRGLEHAMSLTPYKCFGEVVRLYAQAIQSAKREHRPDVVVCCVPEFIEKKCWSVQRPMTKEEKRAAKLATERAVSAQLELPLDWEPEETPEDLLRRDLRRALKAEAMRLEIPIQIGRTHLFLDLKTNEEAAVRAWNSSVGLYYKAGGIPWRLHSQGPETCFVGITFHYVRTNKRALVYASLAQAFSTNGEGFALKGSALEPDPNRRSPHMSTEQAQHLGERVLKEYAARNGGIPKRVILHKSSRFWDEEQAGFAAAFRNVPVLRMVALAPSSIRLVTHASYPPRRGTLLTIEGTRHFLFTSGYVRELGTYPGPHIPIPVELIVHGTHEFNDIREAGMEALALGRLNWNTSDLRSSQPVTLGVARRVGGIMDQYGLSSTREPDPSYRYYM